MRSVHVDIVTVTISMQFEQQQLRSFVSLHAHKARLTSERCAYLAEYKETGMPINLELKALNVEEILETFDRESGLVHWLLKQVSTYNCDTQVIIGLIFSPSVVLAHVIQRA